MRSLELGACDGVTFRARDGVTSRDGVTLGPRDGVTSDVIGRLAPLQHLIGEDRGVDHGGP